MKPSCLVLLGALLVILTSPPAFAAEGFHVVDDSQGDGEVYDITADSVAKYLQSRFQHSDSPQSSALQVQHVEVRWRPLASVGKDVLGTGLLLIPQVGVTVLESRLYKLQFDLVDGEQTNHFTCKLTNEMSIDNDMMWTFRACQSKTAVASTLDDLNASSSEIGIARPRY